MAKLKEDKQQEEIVPLRCYACKLYDGFGPKSEEHTHVCETCKQLPTQEGPITRHVEEYNANAGHYGEETLPCEKCGEERDTCLCPDNPLIVERVREQEVDKAVIIEQESERNVPVTRDRLERLRDRVREQQIYERNPFLRR